MGASASGVFEGVYVAHWEVSRFAVLGSRVLGLLWRGVHKWRPIFPAGFRLPDEATGTSLRRGPPHFYRMRVLGALGPRGHFGHLGICERELTIAEVLACERTDSPGRTW
jgi:hypothetical protein